jgi:hypothetical protein
VSPVAGRLFDNGCTYSSAWAGCTYELLYVLQYSYSYLTQYRYVLPHAFADPVLTPQGTAEKETDLDRATAAFYNLTATHFMGFKMSGGSLEERAAAANKAFGRVSDVHVPASE